MSSRKYEVDHETKIRDLLSKAGLECIRPPPPSTVTTSSSEVVEAEEIIEAHEEEIEKEESLIESLEVIEEMVEDEAVIFPTPSLRRLIPEPQRRIEEMNRIQVLPQKLNTNFAPEAIPIILQTPPSEVIDILGNMTGCRSYKTNLAEYWFLDTMANLLRRAQKDQMDKSSQAALMAWFCEWMKEMQHFDAADRQRMIKRFQDNITAAAKFIAHNHRLPTPDDVGVFYEATDIPQKDSTKKDAESVAKKSDAVSKKSDKTGKKGDKTPGKKNDKKQDKKDKSPVNKDWGKKGDKKSDGKQGKTDKKEVLDTKSEGVQDETEPEQEENFECALVDLTNIAHYIYDLFSTEYQYQLVRSVFTFSPEYVRIDAPYQMRMPKKLLGPQQKHKLVLDKDSTKTSLISKKEKPQKKRDDYMKLLDLQEREERSVAEQENKDRAEWQRRSHILPLSAAHDDDSTHRSSGQSDNSDRRGRR